MSPPRHPWTVLTFIFPWPLDRRRGGALLCLALGLLPPVQAAPKADYRIDGSRSHAEFGVRLFWMRRISGRFGQLAGEVSLNARRDSAVVDAQIAVDSIEMDSDRFRRWVLAQEFFDAERYPTIRFVSEPIQMALLEHGGELHGWLTLRGVTRPARFQLAPMRCPLDAPEQCVLSVHGHIQRGDFGMDTHRAAISDQVDLGLVIALEHRP